MFSILSAVMIKLNKVNSGVCNR